MAILPSSDPSQLSDSTPSTLNLNHHNNPLAPPNNHTQPNQASTTSPTSNAPLSNLDRLSTLVNDLSAQLTSNAHSISTLTSQLSQLRIQASHAGTGFVLRRFNTDITHEVFTSELERSNACLVVENQQLQAENRALNGLLREYEGTLDEVMRRFRNMAWSSQVGELRVAKYYEGLLCEAGVDREWLEARGVDTQRIWRDAQQQHGLGLGVDGQQPVQPQPQQNATTTTAAPTSATGADERQMPLHDPNALESSLAHIAHLLRKAIRASAGELDDDDDDDDPVSPSSSAPGSPSPSSTSFTSPPSSPPTAATTKLSSSSDETRSVTSSSRSSTSARTRPRRQTLLSISTGGYIGRSGSSLSSLNLEDEIESSRLVSENDSLRELLGIVRDVEGSTTDGEWTGFGEPTSAVAEASEGSETEAGQGQGQGRRGSASTGGTPRKTSASGGAGLRGMSTGASALLEDLERDEDEELRGELREGSGTGVGVGQERGESALLVDEDDAVDPLPSSPTRRPIQTQTLSPSRSPSSSSYKPRSPVTSTANPSDDALNPLLSLSLPPTNPSGAGGGAGADTLSVPHTGSTTTNVPPRSPRSPPAALAPEGTPLEGGMQGKAKEVMGLVGSPGLGLSLGLRESTAVADMGLPLSGRGDADFEGAEAEATKGEGEGDGEARAV